ncbi:glutaredoxin family protein [Qipengyuania sp.]|uniref:glutaredoxin family protein n=1 Tax=Qipengyuania sp. TaxID=2004515 RepID=UPI0035C7C20F
MSDRKQARKATVYRMVMPEHICPYGLKTVDLLKREGFEIEDHHLETREETDAFKARYEVETTPQTFIGGERIGGYDKVREYFGKTPLDQGEDATSYQPVIAIFSMAALLGLALSWYAFGELLTIQAAEWFVSLSMAFLAVQKLQDIRSFSTMFLNYDLLARRWVRYGFIYPFGEALAAVLMVAHALPIISVPVALFIGTVGAASVFKAVYIDKRELKCACVGGGSNVPLGFVSLTENLFMIGMGLWMGARALGWITV